MEAFYDIEEVCCYGYAWIIFTATFYITTVKVMEGMIIGHIVYGYVHRLNGCLADNTDDYVQAVPLPDMPARDMSWKLQVHPNGSMNECGNIILHHKHLYHNDSWQNCNVLVYFMYYGIGHRRDRVWRNPFHISYSIEAAL
jgi:hypothetical protein